MSAGISTKTINDRTSNSNVVRFIVKEGNAEKFLEVFDTFVSQDG